MNNSLSIPVRYKGEARKSPCPRPKHLSERRDTMKAVLTILFALPLLYLAAMFLTAWL